MVRTALRFAWKNKWWWAPPLFVLLLLVPLELLNEVGKFKDYHEQNWPQVVADARESLRDRTFDFYFNFVVDLIQTLKLPRDE